MVSYETEKCWLCASSFKEESFTERIKGALEKWLNDMLKFAVIKSELLVRSLFSLWVCAFDTMSQIYFGLNKMAMCNSIWMKNLANLKVSTVQAKNAFVWSRMFWLAQKETDHIGKFHPTKQQIVSKINILKWSTGANGKKMRKISRMNVNLFINYERLSRTWFTQKREHFSTARKFSCKPRIGTLEFGLQKKMEICDVCVCFVVARHQLFIWANAGKWQHEKCQQLGAYFVCFLH